MGGTPSKPGDPARPLEVIGAGYSRTGTVTMQLALEEILDGPVIHGGTHILSREDSYNRKWLEAYQARRDGDRARTLKVVRELTTGYVGITDVPGNNFIPELLELYPDARVVLVTRDPQRWVQSLGHVRKHIKYWWLPYAMAPVPGWRWFPVLLDEFREASSNLRGGVTGNPALLMQKHNEMVKSLVPPDRLLVMELKEGWAPLARFLDRPVPDAPFPRANDADAVDRMAKEVFSKLVLTWTAILAAGGVAVYTGLRFWAR